METFTVTIADSADVHKECNSYCRICANKDPGNIVPIFNSVEDFWSIAEKISYCLHIMVLPSDMLPLNICTSCLKKLNASYELVEIAENAEKHLKEMFKCSELLQDICNESNLEQELESSVTLKQEPFISPIKQEVNGNLDERMDSIEEKASFEVNNSIQRTNSESMSYDLSSSCRMEVKSEGKTKSHNVEQHGRKAFAPQLTIDGPATCDLCNTLFIDMDEFDIHVEEHHKQKNVWLCGLCDNTFESSNELISHKVLVHQEEGVSCDKCKTMLIKEEDSDFDSGESDDEVENEYNTDNEENTIEDGKKTKTEATFNSNESKNENCKNVCNICERNFDGETNLNDHQLVHVPKQVTCNQCDHVCSSLFDLSIHKKEHLQFARDKLYSCEICFKSFITNGAFSAHLQNCFGKEEFTCNICGTMFAHELSLQLHLKGHEQRKRVYECDCGEKCDTYTSFQVHKRNHSDIPSRKCVTCHKEFASSTRYKRHQYIHDPAFWDRYRCQICKRPFRDAQALKNHMQLHTGLKPHMCDLCGRTYNRYANMLKHRRLHKPQNLWEHTCGQCDTKFERAKDLTAHMEHVHPPSGNVNENSDSPNKTAFRWICRFCGKRISSKLSLQDHERIHTGAKPYICEWCGREFRSRPNLIQHHLTHTGDRKHACPVCGKRFSRKSFITQHLRVHTGEKPYVCDLCGKRFTQAGDMRRHRNRHIMM